MKIEEIDKNFRAKDCAEKPDTHWYNIKEEPFEIYGLYNPKSDDIFRRLPEDVASAVNEGVKELSVHTAGGRVRFSTDSPYVALRVRRDALRVMPHMATTGSSGFDLYVNYEAEEIFASTFRPTTEPDGYAAFIDFDYTAFEGGTHDCTIYFPLYDTAFAVEIGILEGCSLGEGKKYIDIKPFVYYGSSITQGGCAFKPGNAYQGFISRRYNADFINLGFSGSARGEKEICDYIRDLEMSIFLCDYDYNAGIERLRGNHFAFYEEFREKQPDTPYVMITKPDVVLYNKDSDIRRGIITKSFDKALALGDRNVYFIDGADLFKGMHYADCTVDSCHPNDLGFYMLP